MSIFTCCFKPPKGKSDKDDMKAAIAGLPVIFVTGGPGSGKGTQCDKIVAEFGFTHLSSGDLLRAKVASGSPDGQELDAIMKSGQLVPLDKVLDLIIEAMAAAAPTSKGFLIDGYPREIEQGVRFEEKIAKASFVIDFDVPDDVMVERLVERGKTSGRLDDNEETIRARLKTYRDATVPVAKYYDEQGKLCRIDANRDKDEIFADVKRIILEKLNKSSEIKPPVFFILGGPGSGKGTQCEKMVGEFGLTHLSSGDLLRAEVASGSEQGQELQKVMEAGGLVSQETVLQLLRNAMLAKAAESKGFLIDGYPRKVEQAELFAKEIKQCAACIYFEVPDELMKSRLLKRGETSGRADDNEETIAKRLETFHNETSPVVAHLQKVDVPVHTINADREIDPIFEDVKPILSAILNAASA